MNERSNTDIVRNAYERFATGDIDGLLSLFHDDIDWTVPEIENTTFGGSRHGLDAVKEFFTQLQEDEEISEFEPREYIAQGNRVVVLGHSTATARSTGRTYSTDWVHVLGLSEGKITTFQEFFDNALATKAFQKGAAAEV